MLFFNANFICYYFYPTKKREEPFRYRLCSLNYLVKGVQFELAILEVFLLNDLDFVVNIDCNSMTGGKCVY